MLKALRAAPVRHWILLTGEAEGAITLDALQEKGRAAIAADPQLLAQDSRRSSALRLRHPLSDLRRHRRTEDGAGNAPGHRLQSGYGPECSAHWAGGFHGGVSAIGAHRAAGGDRVTADALRHAGDVLREPAEAAAGYPQSAAHDSAGAAAHVGAHLFHHLHRIAQAAGGGAKGFLRRPGAGAGGGPLPPRRQARAVAHCADRSSWPTRCCSAKCARASAGGCAWRPRAPRR